jgi:hypothetical protein
VYSDNTRLENLSRTIICKRMGSEDVTPRFLNIATRWRWMAGFTAYLFYFGWKITRWQGGPRKWYERCTEEKNQSIPGLESRFPVRPNRGLFQVFFPSHGAIASVGQGLLIIDVLRSLSDTTLPVGLLWTCYHSDAMTLTRYSRP